MYISIKSKQKTSPMPQKIRSIANGWENLIHYYLMSCNVLLNVIVKEIGPLKLSDSQLGTCIWMTGTKYNTGQPIGAALTILEAVHEIFFC